jgi:hypothetical protein
VARIVAGVLAISGGVLVGVSGFVTLYTFSEFSYTVLDFNVEPKSTLFFGVEQGFVAIAAVVVGIVLQLVPNRSLGGFLTGVGAQTVALFIGYLGWILLDGDDSSDPAIGSFLGIVGGSAILAGGLFAWLGESAGTPQPVEEVQPALPTELPPPGWYSDPSGTARLRYWAGASWGNETSD